MGWFESEDERVERLRAENRLKRDRINQQKREVARKIKIEKRKKAAAEFQDKINEEVERQLNERSPDKRKEAREQLHGSSFFLNSVMGLGNAVKTTGGSNSWMRSQNGGLLSKESLKLDKEREAADEVATGKGLKVPKLTRPY